MKLVVKYCIAKGCPKGLNADLVSHTILFYGNPDGMAALHYRLRCTSCGNEEWVVVPKISRKKKSWPYYNESTGVTYESESHEQKHVRENNLTAV